MGQNGLKGHGYYSISLSDKEIHRISLRLDVKNVLAILLTTKGQVTIPQELRRKYQIDSTADVDFIDEDGKIVLRVVKNSTSPFRKLLGRGDVRLSTEEILRLTRAD